MRGALRRGVQVISALSALMLAAGCHTDMWDQNKIHKPLQQSAFFADGASARPFVAGTVAHNSYHPDDPLYSGMQNGKLATQFPFPIAKDDLLRGQERFNIYCSPCHGRLGYGDGMIAQRGFAVRKQPGNYHTDRLRKMPVGHFFDVITNGFGMMYGYANRIQDVKDRWRIVAYIRALQYSQHATPADVPAGTPIEPAPAPAAAAGAPTR